MLIDVIVLLLLILAAFKGLKNGLILALFSFLALLIGLAAAIKLSALAADYIGQAVTISQRWLPFVAFAAVFIVVALLVRLGAKALEGVVQLAMMGWLNRLGGVVFYALIYIFILSIVLFYAVQSGVMNPQTVQQSATYAYIEPLGPKVVDGLGTIIPFFKNMFAQLLQFFEQRKSTMPPANSL